MSEELVGQNNKYVTGEADYLPEMNDDYYTIGNDGVIFCHEFTFCTYGTDNRDNGNCFRTYTEAAAFKEKKDV